MSIDKLIRDSDTLLQNYENIDIYPKKISEIRKRAYFTQVTTPIAIVVFLVSISVAYFWKFESHHIELLWVLGAFLSGGITFTGSLALSATFGTIITCQQLDVLKKESEIAEVMAEEECLLHIIERFRTRAPQETKAILDEEDIKQELQHLPGIADRLLSVP